MPMTTADLPGAESAPKKVAKATPAKPGLDAAAVSQDPTVVKLMWDRAHRVDHDHPDNARALESIDAQLRELGYDV